MQQLSTLVARAANREESAWAELVALYSPLLRSIASGFRLTGEEGADAAQNTWLSLVSHITGLRQPDRIADWLAITMRHECSKIVRRRQREQLQDDWASVVGDGEGVPARVLRAERDQSLWRAVDRLPARQRRLVLALSHHSTPSYKEVAEAISMPIGSIGPSRARALSRLKEMLTEEGIDRAALDLAA